MMREDDDDFARMLYDRDLRMLENEEETRAISRFLWISGFVLAVYGLTVTVVPIGLQPIAVCWLYWLGYRALDMIKLYLFRRDLSRNL